MTTEFRRRVPIEKVDDEMRIVWGWAYVCEENGQRVVDHSGQIWDADAVQKTAHGFATDSRVGGVMHQGQGGHIVDTLFFSKAIQEALGINCRKVGWFIGFKVDDDDAWSRVKSGELSSFSIGGFGDVETL